MRARPAATAGNAAARPPEARVDPGAQRARDSDSRRILEGELRREEERLAEMRKEYNNGEPERQGNERNYQKYLDRVAEMKSGIARKESDIAAHQARAGQAAAVTGGGPLPGYEAYDQLATMVAIARSDGHCLLANSTLENAVAVSRRALLRGNVLDWFIDPLPMRETLLALHRNEVTSGRFEAQLKRAPLGSADPLLVRVSVSQMDTPGLGAAGDRRDRAADAAGPRGTCARPGAGQQGTAAQPGARDQEPAGWHPRRGATARNGAQFTPHRAGAHARQRCRMAPSPRARARRAA